MIVSTIFWHMLLRQKPEKMVIFCKPFRAKPFFFSFIRSVWACSSNEKYCFFRQPVLSCWIRTVPWSSVPSDWINALLVYMLKGHLEKWVGHSLEIYYRIFPPELHWTVRWMGEYAKQHSPSLATRLKRCAPQSLASGKDPTLLSTKIVWWDCGSCTQLDKVQGFQYSSCWLFRTFHAPLWLSSHTHLGWMPAVKSCPLQRQGNSSHVHPSVG